MDSKTTTTLEITRLFDAPRALVWEVWTQAEHVHQWWGPTHHPAIRINWDACPRVQWRNCLQSPEDGELLYHGGQFREVVKPERLIFSFAWEKGDERTTETLVTITFTERDGKTAMRMQQMPFQSVDERDGHDKGWNSSFDRLDAYLADLNN